MSDCDCSNIPGACECLAVDRIEELEAKLRENEVYRRNAAHGIKELEAEREKVDADYFALDSAWSEQCEQLTAERDEWQAIAAARYEHQVAAETERDRMAAVVEAARAWLKQEEQWHEPTGAPYERWEWAMVEALAALEEKPHE